MKLLTYPPGVQSMGDDQQESVASGAGWDLAYMVSRLQRKSNPFPLLRRVRIRLLIHVWAPLVVHLRRDVLVPRRARGAKVVSSCAPSPPLPLRGLRLPSRWLRLRLPLSRVSRATPPSGPHHLQLKTNKPVLV
jgi:hypothetical protein